MAGIPDAGDRSGVVLSVTSRPRPRRAGVYLLETGGLASPRTTTFMEAACKISTDLVLHPFAYRV